MKMLGCIRMRLWTEIAHILNVGILSQFVFYRITTFAFSETQNMDKMIFPIIWLNEVDKYLMYIYHFYRPQRSWGKVIFSQACVILFTGGVCLSACWDTPSPPTRRPPPGPGTPPGQASPGAEHAGGYGQGAGGTHPTGMQSCELWIWTEKVKNILYDSTKFHERMTAKDGWHYIEWPTGEK